LAASLVFPAVGVAAVVPASAAGSAWSSALGRSAAATPVGATVVGRGTPLATKAAATQKVSVRYAGGYFYTPNPIKLKHGVPIAITFAQGAGCVSKVMSNPSKGKWRFNVDVSAGPRVVKIPALTKGTYKFSCYMDMIHGSLIIK
jgi:hypothetical protein